MKKITFLLLILLSSLAASAQGIFSTTSIILNPDSNLTYGDTVSMTYKVKNVGNVPYTGFLNINYSTDTTAFSLTGFCPIASVTLDSLGSDSVVGTCTITIDSVHFHPGYNIIVVWSSGNAKTAADTLWSHIDLIATAGVHDPGLNSMFNIYPSPATNFINVENSGNTVPLKIFIEDLSGRIIKGKVRINTSALKGGIYFIDMLLPDKRRVVSKFVKAE
jgi:hypothetical protein